MALCTLVGPDNLGRVAHLWSTRRLCSRHPKCSCARYSYADQAEADLTQRRKGAKKRLIASSPILHLRQTFHSYVFLCAFAPLRETNPFDLRVQHKCCRWHADTGEALSGRNGDTGLLDRSNRSANRHHALAAAPGS